MASLIPVRELMADVCDMYAAAHVAFQDEKPGPDRDAAVAELFEFQVAEWLADEVYTTPQASRSLATAYTSAAAKSHTPFGPLDPRSGHSAQAPTGATPVVASLTERIRAEQRRRAVIGRD